MKLPAAKDSVAIILAVGIALALVAFTVATLVDAFRTPHPGIGENATQILTGWGGGLIGILGAYIGYKAGESHNERIRNMAQPTEPTNEETERVERVDEVRETVRRDDGDATEAPAGDDAGDDADETDEEGS